MSDLVGRVKDTIRAYDMIRPGAVVVAGVSGGPDSVAMMHILWQLQDELGFRLQVAHFHHGIRGEDADADLAFVQSLCASWGLPFHGGRASHRARGASLEAVLRAARHRFLREVAKKAAASAVALAHTSDDQAETVLMRLARGTGLQGLGGMAPVAELVGDRPWPGARAGADGTGGPDASSVWVIRPLLFVSRREILVYLDEQGLQWREDLSNRDERFLRNRIRHRVLPFLEKELNPRIRVLLGNLAEQARVENAWLENETGETWQKLCDLHIVQVSNGRKAIIFPVAAMLTVPQAIRRRLWRHAGRELGVAFGFAAVSRLEELLQGQQAKRLSLTGAILAERDKAEIRLWRQGTGVAALPEVSLVVPGVTAAPEWGKVFHVEERPWAGGDPRQLARAYAGPVLVLDADRVPGPVSIRSRKPGDRFRPLGAPGAKKLKDFFIAAGVPASERSLIPVVVSSGAILGVVGFRPDDAYKVTEGTRRIMVIWAEAAPGV